MYNENQYLLNAVQAYLTIRPKKFGKSYFKDYQTIISNSELLRYSAFDENFIKGILNKIQPFIDNNKRYRRKEIIKLLKSHLKKRPRKFKLKPETTKALFKFYSSQIFKVNEELANDLSVILKDLELTDEQIQWLIDNSAKSKYILNRLLRYPQKSGLISMWAKYCLENDLHSERKSEIISYVLDANLNLELKGADNNVMAWGIYYSRIAPDLKEQMLTNLICFETYDSIIKISERLKFHKILDKLIEIIHTQLTIEE
jgi:hypothetical protein